MDALLSLMTQRLDLVVGAIALLVLVAIAYHLGGRVARWRAERRIARNRALGHRAERDAARLLNRAGFTVEAPQTTGDVWVRVDGRDAHFTVRADFIARRAGRRYVVEVKSTEATATMANRDTRRQLLEYACAFQVDGALLVDGANGRVHEIDFPQRRP